MQFAKLSTAANVIVGPILDISGDEYTGAVIGDLSLSKNDATTLTAMAAAATLTHLDNGFYSLVTTTGNTDTLGRLKIVCNKDTYQMPPSEFMVLPAMIYDSIVAGSDRLDVNITHAADVGWASGAITPAAIATGAIDADAVASDAVTEIQSGLATAAQINSLAVNTRANLHVPVEIETPDAATQIYKIRLHLFDVEGNMEVPDSTPTIALTNAAGTDRSSRLSAATNPSAGVYTWDYTATAGEAEEQLVWVFTVIEGGLTRTYPATSYVVEETAYRFSSADRATLNAAATAVELAKVPKSDGTTGWNATARAQLQTEAEDALTAYGAATATELNKVPKSDGTTGWNATARGQIQTEVEEGIAVYDPPTNAEMVARTLVSASYATASVCTEGRLAELDAANLPTDVAANQTSLNTLTSRITAARAGYLDWLNVGSNVATQADINALNQSASRRIILTTVGQFEIPESGTTIYTVETRLYDPDGAPINDDATPTLTATGQTSGSLTANIGAATNPATGVYRWTYTIASTAIPEPIRFDVSATMAAQVFPMAVYTQAANFVAAAWTTTDQAHLTEIFNKLPSRNYLAGTPSSAGVLEPTDTVGLTSTAINAVNAAVVAGQVGIDLGIVKIDVAGLDGAAMRGTDGAATPANVSATEAAVIAQVNANEAKIDTVISTGGAGPWTQGNTVVPDNGQGAAVIAAIPAQLQTAFITALVEGYRANGATGSIRDLLYEILAHHANMGIVGTQKTVKKLDKVTTAKTYLLNDAIQPTAIQEVS